MRRPMILMSSLTVTALVATGCASAEPATAAPSPAPADDCPAPPAAGFDTPDGWIGLAAERPEDIAFVVDTGDSSVAARADRDQPLASAVKVVHLVAYARAVADGTLDPDEQVPVLDWQRWYAPGTDGGAHIAALNRLGIPNDGTSPLDPAATVRLDDMVSAMVRESDNGVPDYLRYRLGDDALRAAASAAGWTDFTPPTLVGTNLGALDPTVDRDDLWSLAQRFAFDADFRAGYAQNVTPPDEAAILAYYDRYGPRGSADDLARVYRAVADGSLGAGVDDVRRQLEWQSAPEPFTAMGFKGGNLPGVLTHGFEFRGDDGRTAVVVWLTHGLDAADYGAAMENLAAHQQLLVDAATDPAVVPRLACVA